MQNKPDLAADLSEWSRWVEVNYPFDHRCTCPSVSVMSATGLNKLRYVAARDQAAILARLYFVAERDEAEILASCQRKLAEKKSARRQQRIALVKSCLTHKHGDDLQALAQRLVGFTPEDAKNAALWDFERHFHWIRAKERGEFVPAKLKPLHEIARDTRARNDRDDLYDALDGDL